MNYQTLILDFKLLLSIDNNKKSMIHDPVNEVTTITIQTFEFIHVQLHLVAIFTAN